MVSQLFLLGGELDLTWITGQKSAFQLLVFNNNIGMQQIMVVNGENVVAGEEISNRIIKQTELQKKA